MKKYIISLALVLVNSIAHSQSNKTNSTDSEIEDRIAIKNIVDTFSILADLKETSKQTFLFTEDATVESIFNGKIGSSFKGRKEIGDAFSSFLKLYQVVYHINGQQTVNIEGKKATAISYCLVTLINTENGNKMKTTFGIYYNDDFVKIQNQWFISKRVSNFVWQEKSKIE